MAWAIFHAIILALMSGLTGRSDIARPARVDFSVPVAQAAEVPPTSVPPAQIPAEGQPPKKLYPDSLGVEVKSKSAALLDEKTGTLLFSVGHDRVAPIASITKLMTAMVFLDTDPNWDAKVVIDTKDVEFEGIPYLQVGETVTVRDAFETALVGSANNAALAIARSTGLSREEFLKRMNAKARELDMFDSSFVDPAGYEPGNVSTTLDVARMLRAALERPDIREALTKKEYDYKTVEGKDKRIPSTNVLLSSFLNENGSSLVGKTGHTDEAGYTLAVRAEQGKGSVIAIVLGAPTSDDRFQDMKSLVAWGFRTYSWE